MIKLNIVSGSLQISLNDSIILVAPKNSCAINVLKLYDAIPKISIYNKYLGNSTSIFNQPLSNCENGGGIPFTIDSFILFAELNLGFDTFTNGGGSLCNPFEFNTTTNTCGIQPCLGTNSAIGYGSSVRGGLFNRINMGIYDIYPTYAKGCSTIGGGYSNDISGYYPKFNTIMSGEVNTIEESSNSFIGGGSSNINVGVLNYGNHSIGGGNNNILINGHILSGRNNIANAGVIVGGYNNISNRGGTMLNGVCNVSNGNVVSGFGNYADGFSSEIIGGKFNKMNANRSSINGGCNNKMESNMVNCNCIYNSVIFGGLNNVIFADCYNRIKGHIIGGGQYNLICDTKNSFPYGNFSLIASGVCNFIKSGCNGLIGGGLCHFINTVYNSVTNNRPSILGGSYNTIRITASTSDATIINGSNNRINCIGGSNASVNSSIILSGANHLIRNSCGIIGNGFNNVTCTLCFSSIMNGCNNLSNGAFSFILNGINNRTTTNSHNLGTDILTTATRVCTTFVNNISIMDIPTSADGLPTKAVWNNNGELNIVP